MKKKIKITVPRENWTRFPNVILDNIHNFTPSEFKVIGVMIRENMGWAESANGPEEYFTLLWICKKTGMTSKTVIKALIGLLDKESIIETGHGPRNKRKFEINWIVPKVNEKKNKKFKNVKSTGGKIPPVENPEKSNKIKKNDQWKNSTGGKIPVEKFHRSTFYKKETSLKETTTTPSLSSSLSKKIVETLPLHYQKSEGILETLKSSIKEGVDEAYIIKEIEYVNSRDRLGKINIGYSGYLKSALEKGFGNKNTEPPPLTPKKSLPSSKELDQRDIKTKEALREASELDNKIESLDIESLKSLEEYTIQNMSEIDKIRYINGDLKKKGLILKRLKRQFFKCWLKENQLPN